MGDPRGAGEAALRDGGRPSVKKNYKLSAVWLHQGHARGDEVAFVLPFTFEHDDRSQTTGVSNNLEPIPTV